MDAIVPPDQASGTRPTTAAAQTGGGEWALLLVPIVVCLALLLWVAV